MKIFGKFLVWLSYLSVSNWSLEASASQSSNKFFGAYTVSISRSSDHLKGTLTIKKDQKSVFKETEIGSYFYFGDIPDTTPHKDNFSGTDLTGKKIPNLVVSKWTGGAHCCHFLYIFEMGNTLRLITKVEAGSSGIKLIDLDGDKMPEIEFYDGAIDYLFASFAGSPPGRMVLKFVHDKYEVSSLQMYKNPMTSKTLEDKINKIRIDFKKNKSPDLPFSLLELMMNLSYSGHFPLALRVADLTWPSEKPGLANFKLEFHNALNSSPYWKNYKW